jgi:hypothetical protein
MKPPRVFIKQGSFWISCYVEGQPNDWRWPTGIKLDPKFVAQLEKDPKAFTGKPDWWKASKHAPEIREKTRSMESERELFLAGKSERPQRKQQKAARLIVSKLPELLKELNSEGGAEHKLSPETIRRRQTSANTLLRYDPAFAIDIEFDKIWIADFRKWMRGQKKPFTEWTQYTILQDLKLFVKFAYAKRYIERNTLADIRFTQPESSTEHTPRTEEFKLFTWLYHHQPKYFLSLITQRLAGYRISDVIAIERSQLDLKNNLFRNVLNVKGHRPEVFPISDALAYIYKHMEHEFGIAYPFPSSYRYTMDVLQEGCKKLQIRKIPTHQFKRNYAGEIEDIETLTHIFDLLMHHKTKSVAGRSYTGKNIEFMRSALNKAQPHWIAFVKKLVGKTGTKQGLSTKKPQN